MLKMSFAFLGAGDRKSFSPKNPVVRAYRGDSNSDSMFFAGSMFRSSYGSSLKKERSVPSLPPMSRMRSPGARCPSARPLSATSFRMRFMEEFDELVYGY